MTKLLLTLILIAFSRGVLCNSCECDATADFESQCASIGPVSRGKGKRQSCSEVEPGNAYTVFEGMGAYKLHKCEKAWNDARISCLNQNAVLAIINSDEEGAMLVDWMNKAKLWHVWIGTHGYFNEKDWVTLTGESLKAAGYQNWLPGEPNNADDNEHCGSLVKIGGMNDFKCDSKLPYFCKIYMCADLP